MQSNISHRSSNTFFTRAFASVPFRNVIEAAYDCQKSGNGRLLAVRNCDELEMFRKELFFEGYSGGNFSLGLFANVFIDNTTRKRASDMDDFVTS